MKKSIGKPYEGKLHVRFDEGGYDILSYDKDGNKLLIEVKTTKGTVDSTFSITRNELEKSKIEREFYRLYRLYKFDEENKNTELLIIKGDLSNLCEIPLMYKVKMRLL